MLLVAGNMTMCKKIIMHLIVNRASFIESVGILSADLNDKAFANLCDCLE